MTLITLRNEFHDSEARVRVGRMSRDNARRVRSKLCGANGCTCGQSTLATRGSQRQDDGSRVGIEEHADGSVDVFLV